MSSRFKEDSYVTCPYYKKESSIEIKCEGICGSHTINVFESARAKEDFKDDFCMGFYWNCPLFRGLDEDGHE